MTVRGVSAARAEQVQQGLLEVGVLLAAVGIVRARGEHRVDGGEEARGRVLVAVDLRRIHAVEDHRLQPVRAVAHDGQRQARAVRQPVQIPLVVSERGAQIGEVDRALGAGVRGQVDALGRQPVAARHDLLAPSRAIRLAREEDAVLDEVLEVEFRAVQRGLGEPVAALLDEDDVSVIQRPVRVVEEVPERVDGAAARPARRREDERVVGVVSTGSR